MKINIAILEDDNAHFLQLSQGISKWAAEKGHIVIIHHFHTAVDILQSDDFMKICDLLFSDIELQDSTQNGISVCIQLRDNHYHGDIIFLKIGRASCRERV